MSDAEQLAHLRALFLNAPDSGMARIMAVLLGATLLLIVMWLVRRRTLRAEYTPIWAGVAVGLIVIGLDITLLRKLAQAIGAWTISSTVFFLGEIFLLAICLEYAARLSRAGTRIRTLAQEVAVLREQVEELSEGAVGERREAPGGDQP